MTRTEYRRISSNYRKWAKSNYAACDRRNPNARIPAMPPQPPRSEVGQLLLDQAARRANKLYWIGYNKRQAERDAQPRMAPRIPQIAGWDRSEVAA